MKILAPVLSILLFTACTQPDSTIRVVTDAGYTNVQTHGYSWLACSKDDTYATKFTAVNSSGKTVSGTVCSGLLFKGSTIRFD